LAEIERDPRLPTPIEQAENLVLWLGDQLGAPGEREVLSPLRHRSIVGSLHDAAFWFIVDALLRQRVLEGRINHDDTARVTLSFEGWKRYEELHAGRSESKKAFMAMPYGDDLVDRVFRECFKPAVARAGFELVRLDERPKAGLIDDRLRVEILTSRFLISDLTHGNHGAYWEAGFAEGKGKPVIYTCRRSYFDENGLTSTPATISLCDGSRRTFTKPRTS
jgi:hypothetical protein